MALHFHHDASRDGNLTLAYEPGWDWSRFGGNYDSGGDFFAVHWEVKERDPLNIRLHVESPKQMVDSKLNALKQSVIEDVLHSQIEQAARHAGLGFKLGSRLSLSAQQTNKSTEVCRLVLAEDKRDNSEEDRIREVHEIAGLIVSAIVSRYTSVLQDQLGAPKT